MRFCLSLTISLIAFAAAAQAQTVIDNLPPVIIQSPTPVVEKTRHEAKMPSPPIITERPVPVASVPLPAPTAPVAAAPVAPPAPAPVAATSAPVQAAPTSDKPAEVVAEAVVTDPYTVTDVNVDVTADTAAHARDKALEQAQRTAYTQLLAKLGTTDSGKLTADEIAGLVRSFEVQSEHLSPVRYVGVFTINFNQAAVKRRVNVPLAKEQPAGQTLQLPASMKQLAPPAEPAPTHLAMTVRVESLADWVQIKKRLSAIKTITKIDTLDVGRGLAHIDVTYTGPLDDFKESVAAQNFLLGQTNAGAYELYDGNIAAR